MMLQLCILVASFTTLQLFSAYNDEKSSKNQLINTLYNISLYHDTKAAIYRYINCVTLHL